MGFFKSFFSDLNEARKDIGSGIVDTVKEARKQGINTVAENPLLSGVATGVAGAFGGPWAAAAMNTALTKQRGASWGQALKAGALTYGGGKVAQSFGGGPIDYGDGSAFPSTGGDSYAGYGTNAGASSAASGTIDYGDGSAFPAGDGSAYSTPKWDFSQYSDGIAGSADEGFANYLEDFGLADIGGGKGQVFGNGGATGFDQNILEGTRTMYNPDYNFLQENFDGMDDYTGRYGYNPSEWGGFNDAIPAAPTDYLTSPTLRDIYTQKGQDMWNSAKPYIKVGRGLNDLYVKNRMSRDFSRRADEVGAYRDQLQSRMDNYYAPGSAEQQMLQQAMERKDAAAGRNSQYGTRAVNLAAAMAERRAQYAQSLAPTLANLMQQQSGLRGASSALRRGQLSGLWQTGGYMSKTPIAQNYSLKDILNRG